MVIKGHRLDFGPYLGVFAHPKTWRADKRVRTIGWQEITLARLQKSTEQRLASLVYTIRELKFTASLLLPNMILRKDLKSYVVYCGEFEQLHKLSIYCNEFLVKNQAQDCFRYFQTILSALT